jgi:hypothetical protein
MSEPITNPFATEIRNAVIHALMQGIWKSNTEHYYAKYPEAVELAEVAMEATNKEFPYSNLYARLKDKL